MLWLDLKGPVEADTVYSDGTLVAKDAAVTLPSITPVTADFKAMGTMSLPMVGQIEDMELSITKVGIDLGLGKLVLHRSMTLELRWAQSVTKADGVSSIEGCKAFLRGVPKTIPGLGIDPGNMSENDITAAITRYQLFVGGTELWLIDRLAGIYRILGTDYYKDVASLL